MSIRKKNFFKLFYGDKSGSILLFALVFGSLAFTLIVVGVSGYAIFENRASTRKHNREMAFQIADAGINYYRWHLAHDDDDYQDGTGISGPYVHEYKDKDGNVIGHFSLNITPPASGSTVVTVESTGWLDTQVESLRIIKARIGFPSLTDYAFLTDTDVWIGDTETTHGKFHSNGGIRFDGVCDAPVTSMMPTYTCKVFHGCSNQTRDGVWGDGEPSDYWQFPMPEVDFDAVTAKLGEIKEAADPDNGGIYLSSSGKQGWHLQFLDNGKISIRKVKTADCYWGKDIGDSHHHLYCIDAKTFDTATLYDMPSNGYIYVEDNVWVDGTVNGRATIGTAEGKSIIINGNITYHAKDGNHVLGLIADQNILVPYNSPNELEIDAALLAHSGAAKRYDYPGNKKDNLYIYGSVISAGIWTWSWASAAGVVTSGYINTNSTYDSNLSYGPPPGFPVGKQYVLISWEVIK
ncbi:MAG: hypothetical protein PHY40_00240 [Patescibacteria group bacterium]|nr:hypothetical protein [Patescibacteria group bacterium]